MFGLSIDNLRDIKNCFVQFPQINKALLYGSRAKGNYKSGSDIDITLIGKNLNLSNTIYPLQGKLDKLYLPYQFDISIFDKLDNPAFIEHILRVGKTLYQKPQTYPKHWQVMPLGEVCEVFSDGNWIESKDQSNGGIRLIQTGNIGFGEFLNKINKARFVSESTFKRLRCAEVFVGDILVSRLPDPVGRSCIIPETKEKMITAVDCTIIRTKNGTLPDFLKYLQLSNAYLQDVSLKTTGTTRSRISRKNLGLIKIPIPPLAEQKTIVKKLDALFSQIKQAKSQLEQNLQNAKDLWQSSLNQAFNNPDNDWQVKPLGEVCETKSGGTPLKSHKDYYENSNIPWLRSGEVCKKDITECELFITQKGLKNSSAKMLPINTILVAMYGATAGQSGILRFESSTNQAVCGILPNENFIPEFLYYKFLTEKDALVKQAVGNAQPNISQVKIKNTLIPTPPLAEQQAIVKKLDAINQQTQQLTQNTQNQLKSLETLEKSLLEKAFSGEL